MKPFESRRASQLERQPPQRRWLVEQLWAEQAVGVVGGEPKCCKSFLALDIAVAVATGSMCLQRFAASRPGPVLLFAAEDALHIVRERLEGICGANGQSFASLDIHVITAQVVRLDLERDRQRLRRTVEAIRPRLVVLDPFVRLHRVDENVAADVAPLLAYLRELQRTYDSAVLLVHHARKTSHARAGQALRGSSEIHAWGDSNLYLRRLRDRLVLTVEHRAAASIPDLDLALSTSGQATALRITDSADEPPSPTPRTPKQRVLAALKAATTPLNTRALRDACGMRTSTLCETLDVLVHDGTVDKSDDGYVLA